MALLESDQPVSGHWSRYVRGIGGFQAIETDTEEPVLQLQDLQGNVVARASISETASKLLGTERSTEYGVPTTTKPAKYGWLGGDLVPTELPSGQVAMGARSYVPELGRFLQTDPVPGGSANAYAYTYGDPVNSSDPSGEFTYGGGEAEMNFLGQVGHEESVRAEAERKAAPACPIASMCVAPEEEGDPCETIEASGSAKFLGATVMKAWAKIKWCWTKGRVVSAYGAGKGELAINHWDVPLHFKFLRREEKAYWEGANYIVERTAIFWGALAFCGVEAPICPGKGYSIGLTFVLEPGGKYSIGSTFENPVL